MAAPVSALSASFISLAVADEPSENIIGQVNEAIKQGTLSTYLETVDPVVLATALSKNWDKAPYLEILEICDAKVAGPLLSALTASHMLASFEGVHHAKLALNAFNSLERIPVFIDVLKLSRAQCLNTLNILDLRSRNEDKMSPFHNALPPLINEALTIEMAHRPGYLEISILTARKRREDMFVQKQREHREKEEKSWGDSRETVLETREVLLSSEEVMGWESFQAGLEIDEKHWRENPAMYADIGLANFLKSLQSAPVPTDLRV